MVTRASLVLVYGWGRRLYHAQHNDNGVENAARRSLREARMSEVMVNLPTVIIATNDILTLNQLRMGERVERPIHLDLSLYHLLKEAAHLPRDLIVLFGLQSWEARAEYRINLRDDIDRISLKILHLPRPLQETQWTIIERTLETLASPLLDLPLQDITPCTRDLVRSYSALVMPLVGRNMNAAVANHLSVLESAWRALISELPPEEVSNLCAVVMGPSQAREGNLLMQFFRKALGVNDRTRVLYADNIYDLRLALRLLVEVLLDQEISKGFKKNREYLERDILGDEAKRQLNSRINHTACPRARKEVVSRDKNEDEDEDGDVKTPACSTDRPED